MAFGRSTSAAAGDLVFVEEEKYLARAMQSGAGAVIAGEFAAGASGKPLLICRHPKLVFARAAKLLQDGKRAEREAGVHASAVAHASVHLGAGAVVEERAVVAENAEIGEGTRIGAGCVIGRGVKIGRECEIYPNVTIYAGTMLGDRVIVHAGAVLGSDGFGYVHDAKSGRYEKFPQVGRLVIEDDVEIGANTTIDRGALEETRVGLADLKGQVRSACKQRRRPTRNWPDGQGRTFRSRRWPRCSDGQMSSAQSVTMVFA